MDVISVLKLIAELRAFRSNFNLFSFPYLTYRALQISHKSGTEKNCVKVENATNSLSANSSEKDPLLHPARHKYSTINTVVSINKS